jgi:hypothetical protein
VGEDLVTPDPNADGDGTIDPGEKLRLTITIQNDAGADILPTGRFELLVGGPTENPQLFQRKYMPRDILGAVPAASHTFNVPAFWTLNYVGDYPGGAGGPFPPATVRAPFYTSSSGWAPDIQVLEVTGLMGVANTLSTASVPGAGYLQLNSVAGFADDDYIVVDRLGANPEYYKVYDVDAVNNRLSFGRLDTGSSSNDFGTGDLEFAPWVRVAHAAAVAVEVVTINATLVEGVDYTVDAANGQISTLAGANWVGANPILVSAVTDFVMPAIYRNGYTRQTMQDGSMGSWIGLPIQDGTYGVKVGGSMTFSVVPPRTLGTGTDDTSYNEASVISAGGSFLVGSATTLGTYPPILLSSATNCDDCHGVPGERMVFHSRRAGAEYCWTCHGTARFGTGSPVAGTRFMRKMIHGYHMGRNLTFASIFEGGRAEHIGFPMFPGGPKHCDKCHGNSSHTQPIERDHPDQVVPYKKYATVCLSCHDSTGAQAHADLNTAPSGFEACVACHDPGSIYNVELVHKNR